MTFETENEIKRKNYAEGVELSAEAKEKRVEEAEKKLAAKERVEMVSKEVKNTKNQIQNIVANMQQVVKAVAAIRAQLQVKQNDDDIPSVKQDAKVLEGLKKKLDGLYGEIDDLKVALETEERKSVEEEHGDWNEEEIEKETKIRVEKILRELDIGY